MSTENDVPLGEGSRRYYEQQFGDRIHQIKKGGSAAQRDSGNSNWNGRAGCGGLLAAFFIIRIILALVRTQSSTPSYQPMPGLPPPHFADQKKPLAEQIQEFNPDAEAALLRDRDVPLPEGLCYRIYQESLRREATPGKHLLKLLDPEVRKLVIKSAQGKILAPKERQVFLDGLNDVLQQADFWDEEAFHQRPRFDDLLATRLRERRFLLERCYRRQIVPLSERLRLNERARATKWKLQAQRDLEAARLEFER